MLLIDALRSFCNCWIRFSVAVRSSTVIVCALIPSFVPSMEISLICARCSGDIVNFGSFGGGGMAMTTGSCDCGASASFTFASVSSFVSAASVACGGGVGAGGSSTPGGALRPARGPG